MTVSAAFVEHLHDLLADLGPLRTRRMFGAVGLYCRDLFFAIVDDDRLYLKVDDASQLAFEAAGSEPFTYLRAGGQVAVMRYWRLPEAALDDPEEAARWARMALRAAGEGA